MLNLVYHNAYTVVSELDVARVQPHGPFIFQSLDKVIVGGVHFHRETLLLETHARTVFEKSIYMPYKLNIFLIFRSRKQLCTFKSRRDKQSEESVQKCMCPKMKQILRNLYHLIKKMKWVMIVVIVKLIISLKLNH